MAILDVVDSRPPTRDVQLAWLQSTKKCLRSKGRAPLRMHFIKVSLLRYERFPHPSARGGTNSSDPVGQRCLGIRCTMVAAGNLEQPADSDKWPLVEEFVVLGHALQGTGSTRCCWKRARFAMWKSYRFGTADRLSLVLRAVVPSLDFRCSRWPPQR